MSSIKNPYANNIEAIGIRLAHFIDTDIEFSYRFHVRNISFYSEPLYYWFIATKKMSVGLKADSHRRALRNQIRQMSWIRDYYSYWGTPARYFLIGYAIDFCRVETDKLTIDLEALIRIFSDKDTHEELVASFVDVFFNNSGLDFNKVKLCSSERTPSYSLLKKCFVNGYRLCTDLYIALDQADSLGPINDYVFLSNAAKTLGFDELPIWYIKDAQSHPLNQSLKFAVAEQKNFASWGFKIINGKPFLVAANNPYGATGLIGANSAHPANTSSVDQPGRSTLTTTPIEPKKSLLAGIKESVAAKPSPLRGVQPSEARDLRSASAAHQVPLRQQEPQYQAQVAQESIIEHTPHSGGFDSYNHQQEVASSQQHRQSSPTVEPSDNWADEVLDSSSDDLFNFSDLNEDEQERPNVPASTLSLLHQFDT